LIDVSISDVGREHFPAVEGVGKVLPTYGWLDCGVMVGGSGMVWRYVFLIQEKVGTH
jgi:hypothetical protein